MNTYPDLLCITCVDVYHVTFIWPEDKEVVQRLEHQKAVSEEQLVAQLMQHHREVHALRKTYRNCLKGIDADQPHVDVFDQGEKATPS
jgi:hypothetical protein